MRSSKIEDQKAFTEDQSYAGAQQLDLSSRSPALPHSARGETCLSTADLSGGFRYPLDTAWGSAVDWSACRICEGARLHIRHRFHDRRKGGDGPVASSSRIAISPARGKSFRQM